MGTRDIFVAALSDPDTRSRSHAPAWECRPLRQLQNHKNQRYQSHTNISAHSQTLVGNKPLYGFPRGTMGTSDIFVAALSNPDTRSRSHAPAWECRPLRHLQNHGDQRHRSHTNISAHSQTLVGNKPLYGFPRGTMGTSDISVAARLISFPCSCVGMQTTPISTHKPQNTHR